jgi:lysophospholipase L1-like esterase/dienelactone hydrolase
MKRTLFLIMLFTAPVAARAQPAKADLPRVVIVGDSIRVGYAPLVIEKLAGVAEVISPEPNGGDSANVLKHLDEWVIKAKPAVVHFNCGLHDLKKPKSSGAYQVGLDAYASNLKQIITRIRNETGAAIVFASTTPIHDDRHAKRKAIFDRFETDVQRYNENALTVVRELGVPMDDLHALVVHYGAEKLLGPDGTHYTLEGYERLATAVADSIRRQLVERAASAKTPAAVTKGDAEAYRKTEAEWDAAVPAYFRTIKAPDFPIPKDAAAWAKQRPPLREKVIASLGDLPPRPKNPEARLISAEQRPGFRLEKIAIDNAAGNDITAILLIPDSLKKPAPAILWLHSSSYDHTDLLGPNRNGGAEPLGVTLVKRGYVVLALDNWWHGDRRGTGPAGAKETDNNEQQSLFKLNLWLGRTLWGMFVRDDQIALDYLCGRPEVDAKRIGATGMSMGSTRAWWLAAVDERIACTVGVACLTRYSNLIAHGQLRQHGVYYFANGLLKHCDTEGVIALIAPRPYLALTGELDAGSPADGVRVIEEKVGGVYKALGAAERFRSVLYPETGHIHTPQMREETLKWFDRWLRAE